MNAACAKDIALSIFFVYIGIRKFRVGTILNIVSNNCLILHIGKKLHINKIPNMLAALI